MPRVDGKTADTVVKGTFGLLLCLILALTYLTAIGKPIPPELSGMIGVLSGVLIGSRVIPSDAISDIKKEARQEDAESTR